MRQQLKIPLRCLQEIKFVFKKNVKFRMALENITSTALFYKLFIEKKNVEGVVNELLDLYGLNEDSGGEIFRDIKEFYKRFQDAEYLSPDLEPYV